MEHRTGFTMKTGLTCDLLGTHLHNLEMMGKKIFFMDENKIVYHRAEVGFDRYTAPENEWMVICILW